MRSHRTQRCSVSNGADGRRSATSWKRRHVVTKPPAQAMCVRRRYLPDEQRMIAGLLVILGRTAARPPILSEAGKRDRLPASPAVPGANDTPQEEQRNDEM